MQGRGNIKKVTNILRSYTYLYLFCASFFGKLEIVTGS